MVYLLKYVESIKKQADSIKTDQLAKLCENSIELSQYYLIKYSICSSIS